MILPEAVPGVAFGTAADGDPRTDRRIRHDLAAELGIPPEWAWVRQIHGAVVVEPTHPGIGVEADALVTTSPDLPIAVSVADCLPVAIVAAGAVGLAHAGWRGTAAGVVTATRDALVARGHTPVRAALGPGIGACCFEVGSEVTDRFPERVGLTSWGTPSVDLPAEVAAQLSGLTVHRAGLCTHHDSGFHSYRRDATKSRQFAVAWVAPD